VKGAAVLEVLAVNAVLLYLFFLVSGDYAFRAGYWASMGFTPTTSLFPFSLVTSAKNGQTSIPGLLTLDWHQVIVAILIVADALYLWSWLRSQRGQNNPPPPISK
jgi:hypothetical protein